MQLLAARPGLERALKSTSFDAEARTVAINFQTRENSSSGIHTDLADDAKHRACSWLSPSSLLAVGWPKGPVLGAK